MKILVLGAGAWGTALAVSAAPRHELALWARDAEQARALRDTRENWRYLPDVPLPASLQVLGPDAGDVSDLCDGCELVVIATPMAGLRSLLVTLSACKTPVAWLCKGFEVAEGAGLLGHEVRAAVAPALRSGVLSGPSFAQEVARGQPTALVAASGDAEVREALLEAIHSATVRVYASDDVAGVEVGGAVKNVLAIATGLCDGLHLGLNARAALITRGLAEMTRLGVALGARPETFMGLSGLGDLVLTATGDLSRNRRVGLMLAAGRSMKEAIASLGHVAEGVVCARAVVQRADDLRIDMPISRSVVDLLDGRLRPDEAVKALMARDATREH